MSDKHPFERAYEIQKKARQQAEKLLEDKSRELFEKNQSLEQALVQLEKQQRQLITQEKLASIGQLGAGLAHELNNPNAFIQNNLETLEDYTRNLLKAYEQTKTMLIETSELTDASEQSRLLEKLKTIEHDCEIDFIRGDLSLIFAETEKGTKRITSIANSLRYFANPSTGARKTFQPEDIIEQAQRLALEATDSACQIKLDLGELPKMSGLPLLLSHALANILSNAVESEPKSGQVCLQAYFEEGVMHIQVKDDGQGISEADLKKVTEPFFTSRKQHNGLGLTIAQNIINEHKGTLKIDSTEGIGTCVTIELPISS